MNAVIRWNEAECYAWIVDGKFVTAGRRPYILGLIRCSQTEGPEGDRTRAAIQAAKQGVAWER